MAVWANSLVLDNGLNHIKNNCNQMAAIANYTAGDSYAAVTGGTNVLASVAMAPSDLVISDEGTGRKITSATGKQDTSANNGGVVSHIAFLDTTNSQVLWVTNETSGQTIVQGNPINFPQLSYTSDQLIQA